jgi:hypothetical protein
VVQPVISPHERRQTHAAFTQTGILSSFESTSGTAPESPLDRLRMADMWKQHYSGLDWLQTTANQAVMCLQMSTWHSYDVYVNKLFTFV